MLSILQHNASDSQNQEKSLKKTVQFFLLLLFTVFLVVESRPTFAQQVAKVSPAGTKYLLYTPPAYSSGSATHPLLVCLHGGSEIGDDLAKISSATPHGIPSRLIYLNQWPTTLPFIVVSPQLKRDLSVPKVNDQEWPATYVDEVIEHVRQTYRVDATRIYLTGISLGAAGCWDYTAAYPAKVAALLPISGKTRVEDACKFKNIPIWAFHGEGDGIVPPKFTTDMVAAINACSPAGTFKPRVNLLHARVHEGWSEIYNGTNGYRIYDWLMKFKKNNTANKTPYVNAGFDQKILLRAQPLHITGDYFDSNGTISVVNWTQTSGAALTLANTNTKFLKISGLKVGVFEFQLSVTDNNGGVSTDKVRLEVVNPATAPSVSTMVLVNGKTNVDIGNITEGQVINKTTLGLTEINVRATATADAQSVRFAVNTDQHVRTINTPGPYYLKKPATSPEWVVTNGDYVICATPYTGKNGTGTPGTSQCFKVTVTSSGATAARIGDGPVIEQDGEFLISSVEEGNQWVFNGKDIEGATGNSFRPTEAGLYQVRLTNDKVSNSIVYNFNALRTERPAVFPNPVSRYINVKGVDEDAVSTQYTILNAAGVEVQRGQLVGEQSIEIGAPLPQGIYTLLLDTDKNHHTVRFIVK